MSTLLQSRRASLLTSLATQNSTLKVSLVVVGSLAVALLIALMCTLFRSPLVVGLTNAGPLPLKLVDETQVISAPDARAFIFDLLGKKYPKQPNFENLKNVCKLFTEGPRAACEKELVNKKVFIPQDLIVEDMTWNDRTNISHIRIKRFANFGATTSAVESSVAIEITKRARTSENPWGLFVQSWKEEVRQ